MTPDEFKGHTYLLGVPDLKATADDPIRSARRAAMEEAAKVADISAQACADHGDEDGAFLGREISTGIRALMEKD